MGPRLAIVAAVLLAAGAAHANGAFPNAGQFIVQPGSPDHLAVRTSFGILVSTDAGQSWGLACEGGIGYVDEEPGIAITGDGTLLAAWSDGVGRARIDAACDWAIVPGVPPAALDVSVQKDDPSIAIALSWDRGSGTSRLWVSTDHGATWGALGVELPAGVLPTTVDVAASDPQRIYVAGTAGPSNPVLLRSIDRAQSWTSWSITTDVPDNAPYLAAVDPSDADRVYVRSAGDPGRLLVSDDGGETWVTGHFGAGPMRGFALAPDGTEILLGDILGVWRAPAATLAFELQSETFTQCLAWAAAGAYGCSNQFVHGFFLGLSADEGASFTPLLSMHCIRLLDCDAETTVGGVCPDDWPELADQLQAHKCDEGGGGGAGGSGGAGAGGAPTTTTGAGGHMPGQGGGDAPLPTVSGGCACNTARPRSVSAPALGVLVALAWAGRNRRRASDACARSPSSA